MARKISESIRVDQAFAAADIVTPRTGTYLPMTDYRQALGVVTTAAVATGKKVTVQLLQAKDAAGTGSKDLGAPVVVTATASGNLTVQAEVNASKLDSKNGFTHIAVRASSDNASAVSAAGVLIRGDGRHGTKRP